MDAVAATESPLQRYRLVGLAVAVIVVVAVIYWQTFSRMVEMWELRNYQHGWLVYPIALFVLWRKREALAGVPVRPDWNGFGFAILLVLAWVVSRAAAVQVAEFLAATLLIFAAFWAVAGVAAARIAAFPLLLLATAVPVGEFLVEPLMLVTAEIASALLHLAGVPVIREGQFFTLPGGSFEVADVCSGLRYLLAGIMASLAFAYVTYAHWLKRLVFVAIGAVALVITNGVRAFIVMAVASGTNMRVLGGEDHVIFGMFLFGVVFVALVWVGERYADSAAAERESSADRKAVQGSPSPVAIALVVLLLAAGPVSRAVTPTAEPLLADELRLPQLAGCDGPSEWSLDWSPRYLGADRIASGSYDCGTQETAVWVATYLEQEQGRELISSTNRVWPNAWRRYVTERSVGVSAGDAEITVREVVVDTARESRLIWYWYEVGDRTTTSDIEAKALDVVNALRLRSARSSVIVLAVSGPEKPEEYRAQLHEAAEAVLAWRGTSLR